MKALTLQLAVISAILDTTDEFSIFDLTTAIRKSLARKDFDIIDIDDEDSVDVEVDGVYVSVPNLPHRDVKISFENLEENGIIEKLGYGLVKQGAYRIFKKRDQLDKNDIDLLNKTAKAAAAATASDKTVYDVGEFAVAKINDCVRNWLNKGETVTLRRISGSVQISGIGVTEIHDIVVGSGYTVTTLNPFYSSTVSF